MKVYLIRHGETDWNKQKCLQGQSDFLLNDYGRELARITGEALKDVPFDLAISSPLSRALETAKLVVGDRDIPMMKDRRIQEISFGDYEGLSYHPDHFTVPDPEFMNFFQAPAAYRVPPNGESFEQILARTGAFWAELVETYGKKNGTILVSTHGCALKAILANIRRTPVEQFWGEGVHKNCAVSIVTADGSKVEIEEGKIFY